jgi:hypothetical protein
MEGDLFAHPIFVSFVFFVVKTQTQFNHVGHQEHDGRFPGSPPEWWASM